jgi:glycosyltransferase involved in cell wall biosynthesis
MNTQPSLTAFPMHGQYKLSTEGYRTRDGHLIEWFGKLSGDAGHVQVVSRPEPIWLWPQRRVHKKGTAKNTKPVVTWSASIPNLRDKRQWWVRSLTDYPALPQNLAVRSVVWNPFAFASSSGPSLTAKENSVVFDLLDDWTIHYAFDSIKKEVQDAYRAGFESARYVTANSEATAELARSFGRHDVKLITNGCDPEIFSQTSKAEGSLTVGYVGKIGKRVDLELVQRVAASLPDVSFVLAGPILDREYEKPLKSIPNLTLLGDIQYRNVPALLQSFDIGWVPHRVGEGEVGGDVIKTYEYRAAGLPVLTTPVLGATDRGLDNVHSAKLDGHVDFIGSLAHQSDRVPRVPTVIPIEHTWKHKALLMLDMLGMDET